MAAASEGPIITPLPGSSLTFPGQSTGFRWGYTMYFNINTPVAVDFCVTGATVPGNTGADVKIFEVNGERSAPFCQALAPGANTMCIHIGSMHSTNGTGTFTYTLDGAAGGTFTASFGNVPPFTG